MIRYSKQPEGQSSADLLAGEGAVAQGASSET